MITSKISNSFILFHLRAPKGAHFLFYNCSMNIALGIIGAIIVFFGIFALTGAPYVPSRKKELELLFKNLYPLKASDHIIDLGSGDGVVLKVVAEHGAHCTGIELNPVLVLISKLRLLRHKNTRVKLGDMYGLKFPEDTSAVYVFGDGRDFNRIERKVQTEANRLNKAISFISYGFESKKNKPTKTYRAYFLYKIRPEKN